MILDRFDEPFAEFLRVNRQNGMLAIEKQFEVRALLSPEGDTLFGQPPLELGTLHSTRVHIIDYFYNGLKESLAECVAWFS